MSNPEENKDKTILVVDDDAALLTFIRAFIEQLGHKVLPASSGHRALKVARGHDGLVDLLLTDVTMPNMNGFELAMTLVSENPDIKVIFMSGYLKPSIDSSNTPSFEDGFIKKPFSGKTLTTHIQKAVNEMNQSLPQPSLMHKKNMPKTKLGSER